MSSSLAINGPRLLDQLRQLADIGRTPTNACCRLALTDDDKLGRDLVVRWMKDLGMAVTVDPVGNIFGVRTGTQPDLAPIMTGSHIDTVRTGGAYDGNYGVLAGLEVVATLNDAKQDTKRSLVVGVFTNEEGARFAPDMLGSLVYVGGMPLKEAVVASAVTRAQPIVLTGLAAMMGAFFILDDPIFNGLAISLIFGIFVSTVLTLLVIPLTYYMAFKNKSSDVNVED